MRLLAEHHAPRSPPLDQRIEEKRKVAEGCARVAVEQVDHADSHLRHVALLAQDAYQVRERIVLHREKIRAGK
ncbi:MAG TPA: hypothetical protein VGK04_08825, partial [Thermoanaerobaculia bacterium]